MKSKTMKQRVYRAYDNEEKQIKSNWREFNRHAKEKIGFHRWKVLVMSNTNK